MKLISDKDLHRTISEYTDLHGWGGNSLMVERKIKEMVKAIPGTDAIIIGQEYSSGDYKIITEDHKGYQTFRIVKRRA